MATEESRHDSQATAPAATSSKRKLPGSFSAQIGKPAQQAALQSLRLPAVSSLSALMRTSLTCLRHSSQYRSAKLRERQAGDWLCSLGSFTTGSESV